MLCLWGQARLLSLRSTYSTSTTRRDAVMVLNNGSSSLKCQILDVATERVLLRARVDRIGGSVSSLTVVSDSGEHARSVNIPDHFVALAEVIPFLAPFAPEIRGIGHRIVHGGEDYSGPVLLTSDLEEDIESLSVLAPLHNPPNLAGVKAAKKYFPGVPNVAMFDTAFHQTMQPSAFLYGLPYQLYTRYKIRKYGFHGHSHYYVSQLLRSNTDYPSSRIITLHLGSGCSACAIRDGISVDTSMGFTPLEGLLMSTRPGDTDASIPLYLLSRGNSLAEVEDMLQKGSGLLGLSGLSNDMQTLVESYFTNDQARLAVDVFVHRVRKYIGSFAVLLGGVDCIIFTGGIGENSSIVRELICSDLQLFGVELDPSKNNEGLGREAKIGFITALSSPCRVAIVKTDEELVIGRETARLVLQKE